MKERTILEPQRDRLGNRKDFTVAGYIDLIRLAKQEYTFLKYSELADSFQNKYVLWRHDCDLSLNRSLRIARIERDESVVSTFFLNPHSQFYNLLEYSQAKIIEEILSLEHDIGLHFDAHFYDIDAEHQLEEYIGKEASWLQEWFGVQPVVFSFHNPSGFLLTCERDSYSGLINCYSSKFKESISYCSDSNGYWRHESLNTILAQALYPRIQVLTHAGWWQEEAMFARERIFRCIDGRANAIMGGYDECLEQLGRKNLVCTDIDFQFLKNCFGRIGDQLDYQWMRGEATSVFLDTWRLFDSRLVKYSRIMLCKLNNFSPSVARRLLDSEKIGLSPHKLLAVTIQKSWQEISGIDETHYLSWRSLRFRILKGQINGSFETSSEGMKKLIETMKHIDELCRKVLTGSLNASKSGIRINGVNRHDDQRLVSWIIDHSGQLEMSNEVTTEFLEAELIPLCHHS